MHETPSRPNKFLMYRIFVAAMATAVCSDFALAQDFDPVAMLTGTAAVQDGDGLLFGDVEIRLKGIAAPERKTELGKQSTRNLRRLAEGKQATCYLDGTRAGRSLRPVAVCMVDGRDLGEMQVLDGMALDCARFSRGRYADAEELAFQNGQTIRAGYRRPRYCQ